MCGIAGLLLRDAALEPRLGANAHRDADRGRPLRSPSSRRSTSPPEAPSGPWPIFIFRDSADYCYGLPGGRDGEVSGAIKVGAHHSGKATTAAGRDGVVDRPHASA